MTAVKKEADEARRTTKTAERDRKCAGKEAEDVAQRAAKAATKISAMIAHRAKELAEDVAQRAAKAAAKAATKAAAKAAKWRRLPSPSQSLSLSSLPSSFPLP